MAVRSSACIYGSESVCAGFGLLLPKHLGLRFRMGVEGPGKEQVLSRDFFAPAGYNPDEKFVRLICSKQSRGCLLSLGICLCSFTSLSLSIFASVCVCLSLSRCLSLSLCLSLPCQSTVLTLKSLGYLKRQKFVLDRPHPTRSPT